MLQKKESLNCLCRTLICLPQRYHWREKHTAAVARDTPELALLVVAAVAAVAAAAAEVAAAAVGVVAAAVAFAEPDLAQ